VDAPGSFELVAIAHALASRADVDAVVCLGCVITGETTHDRYICEAVANGFADITARTGKPVAFGVLTCQTVEQAVVRSGGGDGARSSVGKGSNVSKGNKGEEAMHAALIAARAVERIQRLPLGRPA
jgi:6,7-dimethyl-8-ribityllumazine synthase